MRQYCVTLIIYINTCYLIDRPFHSIPDAGDAEKTKLTPLECAYLIDLVTLYCIYEQNMCVDSH